ncbi:GNAT family N-acetyltransferase [Longivirga aurantiaca]|uniref:GNAT family N-acetyltransferase n=1 Tax=Longivirga aurantiaca TaxID=1837743 RepID=A0ABW1T192_9ACTN
MRFAPLTAEQAAAYLPHSQQGFADDLVRAGALDAERALRKAVADYSSLDEGGTTYVAGYADIDGTEQWVGVIGWALTGFDADHEERTLYIYDLEVFERFRQRGFAEGLLAYAAQRAAEAGADAVRLTVWAGNDSAEALYRKVGFLPEQQRMRLRLSER